MSVRDVLSKSRPLMEEYLKLRMQGEYDVNLAAELAVEFTPEELKMTMEHVARKAVMEETELSDWASRWMTSPAHAEPVTTPVEQKFLTV